MSLLKMIDRVCIEPPFRLAIQKILALLPVSVATIDRWELSPRPQYFAGVYAAALQAKRENATAMIAIELGVAGGRGLLALEWCAAKISASTGIRIQVVGFDTGVGLPQLCGDYRDHPDHWAPADYPMDEQALRKRLRPDTRLILGNVSETIPAFVEVQQVPVGFIAFDLDLYSSTKPALTILSSPHRRLLRRTFLYFDDVDFQCNHRFAGELLAIAEFNDDPAVEVRIDTWRGVGHGRPFHERPWLRKMWIAHDLRAISQVTQNRAPVTNRCHLD